MKRLITLALVLLLATAATAAAKSVIFTEAHGGDFVSKPEKLKDLHWKNWGSGRATSTATVNGIKFSLPTP